MTALPMPTVETLRLQAVEQNQVSLDIGEYLEREQVGDSELFVSMFGDRVRYDRAAHTYFHWRGSYWEQDRMGEVLNLISKQLAAKYLHAGADATEKGNQGKAAALIERGKALMRTHRVKSTLEMIAVQPEIALTGDEWDNCPMKLPVANGVIDLTTGTCGNGDPDDYLRAHSPVHWMGLDYPAPRWEQFIHEVMNEEIALVNFMQRWLGYCLTGKTTEHRLPILYGAGRNGKSTLMQTMFNVFGEELSFSTQADSLMDMKRDGSGPQPFVYALRGKRLCGASESKEGQKINAGLVKLLTGGDTITTRTLNEKPVTFKPSHKVMLLTNNRPHVNAEDQAMWDRVLLIPFDVRFVDEPKMPNERRRDQAITERLEAEAPGILAWLVRGCLAWQAEGLNPPARVLQATEEYRADEDLIADFIDECLFVGENAKGGVTQLYNRFKKWAQEIGQDRPMGRKAFSRRLARRFGDAVKEGPGMMFHGVGEMQE
jgi:putative DNA primase/helicase